MGHMQATLDHEYLINDFFSNNHIVTSLTCYPLLICCDVADLRKLHYRVDENDLFHDLYCPVLLTGIEHQSDFGFSLLQSYAPYSQSNMYIKATHGT
jgi:hypothetical protein